jgi:hypothetical protein
MLVVVLVVFAVVIVVVVARKVVMSVSALVRVVLVMNVGVGVLLVLPAVTLLLLCNALFARGAGECTAGRCTKVAVVAALGCVVSAVTVARVVAVVLVNLLVANFLGSSRALRALFTPSRDGRV